MDTAPQGGISSTPDESRYYLLRRGDGGVRLAAGAEAAAAGQEAVLGPVLFLGRPPAREGSAGQTAELLSV